MASSINDLVPELVDAANALLRAASAAGLQPRITSTIRTNAEQTRLYRRFLAGNQSYNVAPPGQSAHEYGLAFDLVVSPLSALEDVGRYWLDLGGGWSNFDAVHFEYPGASEWARSQPTTEAPSSFLEDPYGYAARANENLPWYVQLFTPWQLSLYQNFPSLRALIDPTWPARKIIAFVNSFGRV
jgi:hypothetical protein